MSRVRPGLLVAGASLMSAIVVGCEHRPQTVGDGTNQPPTAGASVPRAADAGAAAIAVGGAPANPDPGATPPGPPGSTTPGAGGPSPSPTPTPTPPPGPSCTTEIEGSETSCKSPADWKSIADELCRAKGQSLTFYAPGGGDCGDGGRTRYVKYECCPTMPVPPPPLLPPLPPTACFVDSQGDDTSCRTPEAWKQYAAEVCKAKGADLSQIDYAIECGAGGYRFTKYTCCPAPPPPGQCQVVSPDCPGSSFDPCAGKECGARCQLCNPQDRGCVETDVIKSCNFVGKCAAETSMCSTGSSSCPAGLTWCFFSGRCVDARCRTCCDSQSAPPCKTAADCGPSCTKCGDGTESCGSATCGQRDANQCFFHEPKCRGN